MEFAELHGWDMDYRAAVPLQRRLARHLDQAKASGEKAWEETKWGFSAALDKLDQASRRAAAQLQHASKNDQ